MVSASELKTGLEPDQKFACDYEEKRNKEAGRRV
jgi:hypothetical protein